MNPGRNAVALNTYHNNAYEAEAELLALMRIDLAINASLPGSYQGEWAWYPAFEHFECNVEVLIPEDIEGYHQWVARGALTFISHYPTDIQRLQDKLADIAAGGEATYPELTMPARQTYGDVALLREVVEQIIGTETPSLLEALHATEMVLHNYKQQLRALCMEIVNATSGPVQALTAQMSTLAIMNTPNEIDNLMRNMGRLYLTD
ncbi:hypothetical protein MMC18_002841 [Xylographa bjoerkii]|nr:hypothetical protein [Xylographa bjoerkii]